MADLSFFPDDLLINILSRLPIKYVLRSRSVCKNWNFILRSPNFFSLYYKHQSCGQERLEKDGVSSFLVLEYVENDCHKFTYPIPPPPSEYDSYDPAHVLLSFLTVKKMGNELITTVDKVERFDTLLTLPSLLLESLSTEDRLDVEFINFVNVYDGIICLESYIGVVLYNPYTRESQRLPFLRPIDFNNYSYDILGMWLESNQQPGSINHYKVFRQVILKRGGEDPNARDTYLIEKYDSAEGCWSEIKTIRQPQDQYNCHKCLLFNEIFHLYVDGDSVVTLDARLEKFGVLPLPSEFLDWDFESLCLDDDLFVFGRSLALFACNREKNHCKDLWMMSEYGVKESWTKQYSFLEEDLKLPGIIFGYGGRPFDFDWKLLAQWKCMDEDELFVEMWDPTCSGRYRDSKFVSFNLASAKVTEIYVRQTLTLLSVVPYRESFFSFN